MRFSLCILCLLLLVGCSGGVAIQDDFTTVDLQSQFMEEFTLGDVTSYSLDISVKQSSDVMVTKFEYDDGDVRIVSDSGIHYAYDSNDVSTLFNAKIEQYEGDVYSGTFYGSELITRLSGVDTNGFSVSYSYDGDKILCDLYSDSVSLDLVLYNINNTVVENTSYFEGVTKKVLLDRIKDYNIKEPSSKCYEKMLNIINNYPSSLDKYKSWGSEKKTALAYLIKLELIEIDLLFYYDVDINELISLVNNM